MPHNQAYDNLFQIPAQAGREGKAAKFEFNEKVAQVFDNMLERSIPFYKEQQTLISDFIIKELETNKTTKGNFSSPLFLYDLGCSTGNFLLQFRNRIGSLASPFTFYLIGLDKSPAMIKKAQEKIKLENKLDRNKLDRAGSSKKFYFCFQEADILNHSFKLSTKKNNHPNSRVNVFILNYTLQFISSNQKNEILNRLFKNLSPGGILVLSEKVVEENESFTKIFDNLHQDFKKKNNYSQLEIARKRQALEKILIPQKLSEHFNQLKEVGFKAVSVLFKVANFAVLVAKKSKANE